MVNLEENMENIMDAEKRVTEGDSRKLTRTKRGNWHGWQKCYRELNYVTLKIRPEY